MPSMVPLVPGGLPHEAPPRLPTRPRVLSTTPLLVVADLQRAIRFCCDILGFAEPSVWGEPPCFAMLHRDGFELMLSRAEGEACPRPNGQGTWDVYVRVADVTAETTAIQAAGGKLDKGPTDTTYAMREVEVVDADGHRWCFAQDIGSEPPQAPEVFAGVLDVGTRQLRLVLRLARTGAGAWRGQLDSLDQGVMDLSVERIVRTASALGFEMLAIGARYAGTIRADGKEIAGQWSQMGRSWPLTLRRE